MSTPEALRSYAADEQLSDRYATAMLDAAEAIERLTAERDALNAAEEGAKEAFGVVVQEKQDALAECKRLRVLLAAAHAQIRSFYLGTPETRLAAALTERDALRKDAERYRWMRDESTSTWLRFQDQWQMTAAQCDATIDREMAAHAKAVGAA